MLVKSRFIPGESYVYEKVGSVTYARRAGDPPNQRFEIGRDVPAHNTIYGLPEELVELLCKIELESQNNPVLHKLLEQCKILYHLSKNDSQT